MSHSGEPGKTGALFIPWEQDWTQTQLPVVPVASSSCPGGYHLPLAPKPLAAGDLTFPDNGKQLTPKSRLLGAKPAISSLFINKVAHACPIRECSLLKPLPIMCSMCVWSHCAFPWGQGKDLGTHNYFSCCLWFLSLLSFLICKMCLAPWLMNVKH